MRRSCISGFCRVMDFIHSLECWRHPFLAFGAGLVTQRREETTVSDTPPPDSTRGMLQQTKKGIHTYIYIYIYKQTLGSHRNRPISHTTLLHPTTLLQREKALSNYLVSARTIGRCVRWYGKPSLLLFMYLCCFNSETVYRSSTKD